ncbi:hypothetical protein [Piscirickettsia salmonis]|uniref:hypothetical protein n=1 Tax=Piscirickettsia salmonis TaxID=1238 RepID=UPI0012B84C45|nr:hypothetical protein [Piscirickettsia salmonis]
MLGDFASLDVQNTYRGSDAYGMCKIPTEVATLTLSVKLKLKIKLKQRFNRRDSLSSC